MTAAVETPARGRSTPWHFWVVTAVAILWNGFGAYDYLMSHLSGEPYYRQMGMTDAQIAFFSAMPSWMHAVWAIGVWGSVAGSILLLLRMKWAFQAFVLSFLGVVGNIIYVYGLTNGAEVNGGQGGVMTGVIAAGCLLFAWYAWAMTKRGVLR